MNIRGYYFITDSTLSCAGNPKDVKNAISAGVKVIQYREKNIPSGDMYNEAHALRKVCGGALFLVNDRVDIALAVCADGVHIGQGDASYRLARKLLGKYKIIGVTAHNLNEAMSAERMGADYVGISPIFKTTTKQDAGDAIGIGVLKSIRKRISIPIVAIGGINLSNVKSVIDAGADAVCAISEVVTKPDPVYQIKKFQEAFKK